MAKVIAPLMGLSARGTIADTLTYSGWKGIEYARQRVIPANPQTASQSQTRDVFRGLGELWNLMSTLARAPWIANAVGRPYTPRNGVIRYNLSAMRAQVDCQDFVGSPGALAGIAPASIAAAFAAGVITVTLGAPTLPLGWTIQAAVAIAFPDQDPHNPFVNPVREAEDLVAAPYAPAIAQTAPLGLHVVSGWFRFVRPDTRIAYGPSLQTTVTVV